MADKVSLVIDVTPEVRQHIETLARQHGFDNAGDYLLSLVDTPDDKDETKEQLLEAFREGWHAAMTGDTIPASELRKFIESDDE